MLERYIKTQTNIRVYPSSLPAGSGDQAACINIMDWLRDEGFNGFFEVIYHDVNSHIILSLFGLPPDLPSDYEDSVRKIRFVKFADYYARFKQGKIEQVDLALTAGKGESLCVAASLDSNIDIPNHICANDAILLNAKAAVVISPWLGPEHLQIIQLQQTKDKVLLTEGGSKFFTMPVKNLADAVNYLATDPKGKAFLRQNPAIHDFIDGMEKQTFNLVPAYGYGIQKFFRDEVQIEYPSNILTIIAGCRELQKNGRGELQKPIVIPVFTQYKQEANEVLQFINSDNWGDFDRPGSDKAKQVIKDLNLRETFSIADLSDTSVAKAKLANLKPGQVLLLTMGQNPLPKILFDGLFNHNGTNVLTFIREGQNSMNTLLLTGKPHMRCGGGNYWEPSKIGYGPSPELKATYFQKNNTENTLPICNGFSDWENSEPHKLFASFMNDAHNETSPLSQYFRWLQQEAAAPGNDRIYFTLQFVHYLLDGNKSINDDKENKGDEQQTNLRTYTPDFQLDAFVILALFFIGFFKKIVSPFLPYNQLRNLTNDDVTKLNHCQTKIDEMQVQLHTTKTRRAFRHCMKQDVFYKINVRLETAKKKLNKIRRVQQVSSAKFSKLEKLIEKAALELIPFVTKKETDRKKTQHANFPSKFFEERGPQQTYGTWDQEPMDKEASKRHFVKPSN